MVDARSLNVATATGEWRALIEPRNIQMPSGIFVATATGEWRALIGFEFLLTSPKVAVATATGEWRALIAVNRTLSDLDDPGVATATGEWRALIGDVKGEDFCITKRSQRPLANGER